MEYLDESRLANILASFGFLISKDGYIPIVKRNKIVSKGKGMYAPSISAALKVKYAINHRGKFDIAGLKNAFLKEIENELKMTTNDLVDFSLEENMIAAFRDIVE